MNKLTMEEDEKASAMDTCSNIICRTCANTCGRFYSINSNISYFTPTLKDMIILLVPQMETLLDENDVICITCRKILIHCVKFIEKCLSVQADLKNRQFQKSASDTRLNDLEYTS